MRLAAAVVVIVVALAAGLVTDCTASGAPACGKVEANPERVPGRAAPYPVSDKTAFRESSCTGSSSSSPPCWKPCGPPP